MADLFPSIAGGTDSPFEVYQAITPSDSVDLPYVSRWIYVGGAGDVTLVSKDGSTVLFKNVVSGDYLPVRAVRVKATGTTATYMVNLV